MAGLSAAHVTIKSFAHHNQAAWENAAGKKAKTKPLREQSV